MNLKKLHVTESDYHFFHELTDEEKLEVLSDNELMESLFIETPELDETIDEIFAEIELSDEDLDDIEQNDDNDINIIDEIETPPPTTTELENALNADLVLLRNKGDNVFDINSNSLKAMRRMIRAFIDAGYMLIIDRTVRKPKNVPLRYWKRVYYVGKTYPLCVN